MTEKEKHILTIQMQIANECGILDEIRLKTKWREATKEELEEQERVKRRIKALDEVIEYLQKA